MKKNDKLADLQDDTMLHLSVDDLRFFAQKLAEELKCEKNDELLTLKETLNLLRICRANLWKLEKEGKLIPHRCGRKLFYYRNDIHNYLNNM